MVDTAPFLLVTDLDNTLIGGNPEYLEEFNQVWRHCQKSGSKLVYNTGRSIESFKEHISEGTIVPDAFIGGVGTKIHTFQDQDVSFDSGIPDARWEAYLCAGGWDKEKIVEMVSKGREPYKDRIFVEEAGESPFKYTLISVEKILLEELRDNLKRELDAASLEAQIIS